MRDYLGDAEIGLRFARLMLEGGDLPGATHRAYYACFEAARGTLLTVVGPDSTRIKTHAGLIHLFSVEFVKSGRLPRHIGTLLGRTQQLRLRADYGDEPAAELEAEEAVRAAEAFVAACRALLEEEARK